MQIVEAAGVASIQKALGNESNPVNRVECRPHAGGQFTYIVQFRNDRLIEIRASAEKMGLMGSNPSPIGLAMVLVSIVQSGQYGVLRPGVPLEAGGSPPETELEAVAKIEVNFDALNQPTATPVDQMPSDRDAAIGAAIVGPEGSALGTHAGPPAESTPLPGDGAEPVVENLAGNDVPSAAIQDALELPPESTGAAIGEETELDPAAETPETVETTEGTQDDGTKQETISEQSDSEAGGEGDSEAAAGTPEAEPESDDSGAGGAEPAAGDSSESNEPAAEPTADNSGGAEAEAGDADADGIPSDSAE